LKSKTKILVVGTTSDYIDWIRIVRPGGVVFLTDYSARQKAREETPPPAEEILTSLEDGGQAKSDLLHHMKRWNYGLAGIACFDCESMELAASLAQDFSLPYPTIDSIRLCRDKHLSKMLWQQNAVRCPRVRSVRSAAEIFSFMQEIDRACVIKPLTGSGSELVFRCTSKKDCDKWGQVMLDELKKRKDQRLFVNATAEFLAEEYVSGVEHSCDFIVHEDGVKIVRLTRKIHAEGKPFGTIAGYVLLDYPDEAIPAGQLEETLSRAARALGIRQAICMVDFLVAGEEIILLEMTPRPGGDCIPHLLRRSGRMDILSVTLDFAAQHPMSLPGPTANGRYVGLRLHAKKPGQIMKFHTENLQRDERVKEIHLIRPEGHQVTMPPADYDSWYLGYVIFQPDCDVPLETQCREINREFALETAL